MEAEWFDIPVLFVGQVELLHSFSKTVDCIVLGIPSASLQPSQRASVRVFLLTPPDQPPPATIGALVMKRIRSVLGFDNPYGFEYPQ